LVIQTDCGNINSWDCYKSNAEVGDLISLECASVEDKITITVINDLEN
jgi:hypothetical protein